MKIISLHIPKTGGISFREHLKHIYGVDSVIYDYPPNNVPVEDTAYDLTIGFQDIEHRLLDHRNTYVFHGHFKMTRYNGFHLVRRIVWIRNPVERLVSHFNYFRNNPDHNNEVYRQMIDNALDLRGFGEIPIMRNFQSLFLDGMDISQFDFVGLTESYDRSIRLFYKMFCPNLVPLHIHENKRKNPLSEIDQGLIEYLGKMNAVDFSVYQSAKKRFNMLCDHYNVS